MKIVSTSEPQDLCFHKRPMDGSCPECAENLKRNQERQRYQAMPRDEADEVTRAALAPDGGGVK